MVERPNSVVKELVENAMDAGATSITVEIKEGGISFIRITDNGTGIEKSEIRNAFLRHATSKIKTAEDLSNITSLGFRGEALSSICAVAQVGVITKVRDSLTGIRFCIEGGMNEQDSYGLSDVYISRVDKATTERQLLDLHSEMVFDYAKRMKRLNKKRVMNIYCIKAMEYISNNLHRSISVNEVADHLKIDRSYFSKLFKNETGMTVTAYIRRKKISAAQDMLIYTDLPCSAVSEILGFASQSYFTENFKRLCGMTPGEYRTKNYRRYWDNGDRLDG